MVRGVTLMKCTERGKRFWGPDIELGATSFSQPLRCPKCGSVRTRPSRLVRPFTSNTVYKKNLESDGNKVKWSAMSCLMVADLICPKCGGPVVWCNGGDVIYDFSLQFKATCPSCSYEDWEFNFPRGKERIVEERMKI